MKRFLTTLLLVSLVVFHAGVGRADKMTLESLNQTLRGIRGSGNAKTIVEAARRRVSWTHARNQLQKWQRQLKTLRAKGRGDNTKVSIKGKPVGTLAGFERDLAFRVGVVKAALLNNERVFAKLNQKIDNEWGILARAAHDFESPNKSQAVYGTDRSKTIYNFAYRYQEYPAYFSSIEASEKAPYREVSIDVYPNAGGVTKALDSMRKLILNRKTTIAAILKAGHPIVPTARAIEISYKGVPVLIIVDHQDGSINAWSFVENVQLASTFHPINPKGIRADSRVGRMFITPQVNRELPKVVARLHRLIDEYKPSDPPDPSIKRKDRKWDSILANLFKGLNMTPFQKQDVGTDLESLKKELEDPQFRAIQRTLLEEKYGTKGGGGTSGTANSGGGTTGTGNNGATTGSGNSGSGSSGGGVVGIEMDGLGQTSGGSATERKDGNKSAGTSTESGNSSSGHSNEGQAERDTFHTFLPLPKSDQKYEDWKSDLLKGLKLNKQNTAVIHKMLDGYRKQIEDNPRLRQQYEEDLKDTMNKLK